MEASRVERRFHGLAAVRDVLGEERQRLEGAKQRAGRIEAEGGPFAEQRRHRIRARFDRRASDHRQGEIATRVSHTGQKSERETEYHDAYHRAQQVSPQALDSAEIHGQFRTGVIRCKLPAGPSMDGGISPSNHGMSTHGNTMSARVLESLFTSNQAHRPEIGLQAGLGKSAGGFSTRIPVTGGSRRRENAAASIGVVCPSARQSSSAFAGMNGSTSTAMR